MKVTSNDEPSAVDVQYLDDVAVVAFRKNVTQVAVEDQNGNSRTQYEYDEYTLTLPRVDDLETIVNENYNEFFSMVEIR